MLYVVCCMPHVVRCLLSVACRMLYVVCCMPHAVLVCFGVRDTQLMFHVAAAGRLLWGMVYRRVSCVMAQRLRRRTFALLCPRADTPTVYECCYKCISSDEYALAPIVIRSQPSGLSVRFCAVRERCCRVCIERFRDRSGVSQRCSCYGAVNCSVLSRSCNYFMFRPANSQCFLKRSFSKLKQADGVISGAALRRNSCTLPMHSHMRMHGHTCRQLRATRARAH